jgi:hypothetical protein
MSRRFLFICGLHRSGTSLLHRILAAHPDISGFHNTGAPEDEGQHLQSVYPRGREFGGPGKFAFERGAYLSEISPLLTDANREKLFSEWSLHWNLSKPVLMEKSPPNIIRSRFLQAMFPESYFIFLVRHPIAVSLATQKWSHTDLPDLVKHWSLAHQAMLQDRNHLKHHMLLRYEDLVAEPQKQLEAIYRFIGLPSEPVSQPVSDQLNDGYFSVWENYKTAKPERLKPIMNEINTAQLFGYHFDKPYVK